MKTSSVRRMMVVAAVSLAAVAQGAAVGGSKVLAPGEKLLAQGKAAEAATYFQHLAVVYSPHQRAAWEAMRLQGLAAADLALGKAADAETYALGALTLRTDLSQAWIDMGMAQQAQGRQAAALATYTMGLEAVTGAGGDPSELQAHRTYLQALMHESGSSQTQVSAAPSAVR